MGDDIELVIKISEELYKDIQSRDWKNGERWFSDEWKAIHNGTPLPKGHGRLIDADAFCERYDSNINGNIDGDYIFAPTIIKADATESEEHNG